MFSKLWLNFLFVIIFSLKCESFTVPNKLYSNGVTNDFCSISKNFRKLKSSRLYRWNPVPDSQYYNRRNDDDFFNIPPIPPRRPKKRGPRWWKGKFLSVQRLLIYTNILVFAQQIRSSINYLPTLNSVLAQVSKDPLILSVIDICELWLWEANPIIVNSRMPAALGSRGRSYGHPLIAASSFGPFTMDFLHQTLLTRFQPHRYLTAGFLHASLLHLLFNMRYLWTLPGWLQNAAGWPLYLTTFLVSIVTGNLGHTYTSSTGRSVITTCVGSSGGICGLNGLMYVLLQKMGNEKASTQVFTNMLFILLFGYLADGVSNAAHIGGFLGGCLMGILFGPTITTSYSMLRKWSTAVDEAPPDLRELMGFGKQLDNGPIPLWYLWAAIAMILVFKPEMQIIPSCIIRGIRRPGVLSGWQMS